MFVTGTDAIRLVIAKCEMGTKHLSRARQRVKENNANRRSFHKKRVSKRVEDPIHSLLESSLSMCI